MNNAGHWALVTGGSAGIGLAIARELLYREYSVILVSRSHERLQEARRTLLAETDKGEECIVTYAADLTQTDTPNNMLQWTAEQGYAIEVLINNAGMYFFRDTVALATEDVERIIRLNIRSVAMMCRLFGEQMATRGSGYILNISSYSVYMKLPGWSLYSGSKAFVRNFSITFGREMRNTVTFAADSGVSNNHCVLYKEGDQLYLKDVGSTNGTFFAEDKRLKPNHPYKVKKGVSFFLVSRKFSFTITEE
jgi:short-subunit dehydrogenase